MNPLKDLLIWLNKVDNMIDGVGEIAIKHSQIQRERINTELEILEAQREIDLNFNWNN